MYKTCAAQSQSNGEFPQITRKNVLARQNEGYTISHHSYDQRRRKYIPVMGIPPNPNFALISRQSPTVCVGENTIGSVMNPFS